MRWLKTYNGVRIDFDTIERLMITNLCSIGWVEYCNLTAFTTTGEEILIISNVPYQNALDFLDELDQIIESDFHGVVDVKAVLKTVG